MATCGLTRSRFVDDMSEVRCHGDVTARRAYADCFGCRVHDLFIGWSGYVCQARGFLLLRQLRVGFVLHDGRCVLWDVL